MGIEAQGLGSGLDIAGLVTQLMSAERAPHEQRLLRRDAAITADISALGTFKSDLQGLRTSLSALTAAETFDSLVATSSDSKLITATADVAASAGTFDIAVTSLATRQSLAVRHEFSTITETVGTGTLTFTLGATTYSAHESDSTQDVYGGFVAQAGKSSVSVTIDDSNNTLVGVRDAINNANVGATAAIVNNGSAYQLTLTGMDSGSQSSLQIVVDDTGDGNDSDANGLSRMAFNSDGSIGASRVQQTVGASDADFSVNGLTLSSASNEVTDAIDGLSFSLLGTTSKTEQITVTDNSPAIQSAVNTFVDSYNNYVTSLSTLTQYNATTNLAGPLLGDFTVAATSRQIREIIDGKARGAVGELTSLSQLGIRTASNGTLTVDTVKLNAALKDNFEDVRAIFSYVAKPSSGSGLKVNTLPTNRDVASYQVEISSLATSGSKTGSNLSVPVTIGSGTDAFVIKLDGTASDTITLTNQAYASLAALATELQTKINADQALRASGKSAVVSVEGSAIKIQSGSVGSKSTVELNNVAGHTTVANLGFNEAASSNATDLVGTINGAVGTAEGNVLTAPSGDAAAGLSVTAYSTQGGSITTSNGVASLLDDFLGNSLSASSSLDSRIGALQRGAADITDERAALELRFASIEARYKRQFTNLDILLNRLENTSSFVADQLANIPVPGKPTK